MNKDFQNCYINYMTLSPLPKKIREKYDIENDEQITQQTDSNTTIKMSAEQGNKPTQEKLPQKNILSRLINHK